MVRVAASTASTARRTERVPVMLALMQEFMLLLKVERRLVQANRATSDRNLGVIVGDCIGCDGTTYQVP